MTFEEKYNFGTLYTPEEIELALEVERIRDREEWLQRLKELYPEWYAEEERRGELRANP